MDGEDEGCVEDEVNDNLEDKDMIEKFDIFSKYHSSMVGISESATLLRPYQWGASMVRYVNPKK